MGAAELAAEEAARARELEEQKGRIEFDPELDGEALDDDDLKAVAEIGMKEGSDDEGDKKIWRDPAGLRRRRQKKEEKEANAANANEDGVSKARTRKEKEARLRKEKEA